MRTLVLAALAAIVLPLHLDVIGVSKPAEPLTAARINAILPASERPVWLAYLKRSQDQLAADKAALAAERAKLTGPVPPLPKEGGGNARSMPLNRDAEYYKSPEALHTAETVLSFQIPNGAWSKNMDFSGPPRLPGQHYAANNLSRFLGNDKDGQPDFDQPTNPDWNYVGTLDNDATNTQLHFLARVSAANPGPDGDKFRKSFLRGIDYLLKAQYPNGGWPQVWPLEGGYHDAITYNDNAVTEASSLLHDTSTGTGDYAFVPADIRKKAAASSDKAIAIILKTQIVLGGEKTIWAQQHDALTLQPVAGRNFEPAALSAGESADILVFLMKLPNPSPEVKASVEAGVAWLKANAIYGQAFVGGRRMPPTPGAPAIWPRYTSIQTGKPIFGDRDKTIHDNVDDLTVERKNGYSWYSGGANNALEAYVAWKK